MYTPSFSICVKALLAFRLLGVMFSPVMDCDESFNYLEPLHFWLNGVGLQTWEYAPRFALRSWGYL